MKKLMIFSVIAILLVLPTVNADVGPTAKYFKINLGDIDLGEGYWYISFIGYSDEQKAKNYLEEAKSEYMKIKSTCGLEDDFERSKIGLGVHIEGKNEECVPYDKYVWGWTPPKTVENWQNYVLWSVNFKDFLFTYSNDHKNDLNYPKLTTYRQPCQIQDNYCEFNLGFTDSYIPSEGPYFVVLEKVNSRDQIYFSFNDPINIPWNQSGNVEWNYREEDPTVHDVNVIKFEINQNNNLSFSFDGNTEPIIKKEESVFQRIINWFKNLF